MEELHNKLNTPWGQTAVGIFDLALVYVFASIAIDTASMFAYAAAIFFFFNALIHFVTIFKKSPRPKKKVHAKQ